MLALTHAAGKNPHEWLKYGRRTRLADRHELRWLIYRGGLGFAERLRRLAPIRLVHHALAEKLYFDHVYNNVLVGGTVVFGYVVMLFDKIVIDGLVNLSAFITRVIGVVTGRQLDMAVQPGDIGLVDAFANGAAATALDLGKVVRRPQTGRIRTYVLVAAGSVAWAVNGACWLRKFSRSDPE